jgi:wobble nucleotide-excising tRNase
VLTAFRLIKRVGKFRDVTAGRGLPLDRLTLIYADNGRGKTTLSAILRSLSLGDPAPILKRRRLGETDQPEVIIDTSTGPVIFRDGSWGTQGPKVAIFDDAFVADNVHARMAIDSSHRQHLHNLIIGARGISLSKTLQDEIGRNEQHIKTLAKGGDLVPRRLRGDLAPDKFCDIQPVANLDEELIRTERALAAARDADAVVRHPSIPVVTLPRFDVREIEEVLQQTLEVIQQDALIKVQRHIRALGAGGEAWIADGQARYAHSKGEQGVEVCPYCAQPLSASHVAEHYNAYFSDGYRRLRQMIERTGKDVASQHTGNAIVEFQRQVRVIGEEVIYWEKFIPIKPVVVAVDHIIKLWNAASTPVLAALRQKFTAPLEALTLDASMLTAIDGYHRAVDNLEDSMAAVVRMNADIGVVKEGATAVATDARAGPCAASRRRGPLFT